LVQLVFNFFIWGEGGGGSWVMTRVVCVEAREEKGRGVKGLKWEKKKRKIGQYPMVRWQTLLCLISYCACA